MSKANNLTDFLTDVANAIRSKIGTTGTINPQNFSSMIRNIGGGVQFVDLAKMDYLDLPTGSVAVIHCFDEYGTGGNNVAMTIDNITVDTGSYQMIVLIVGSTYSQYFLATGASLANVASLMSIRRIQGSDVRIERGTNEDDSSSTAEVYFIEGLL